MTYEKSPLTASVVSGILQVMFEAVATEFSFVEALPVRERRKKGKLWEHVRAVKRLFEEKGAVVPQHLVADWLDLSRQRVCQFVEEGRLESVEIHGVRYVTVSSLEEFSEKQRPNGRPPKCLDNAAIMKASIALARDIVKNTSK